METQHDQPDTGQIPEDRGVSEVLQFALILLIGLGIAFGTVVFGLGQLVDASGVDDRDASVLEPLSKDAGEVADGAPLRGSSVSLGGSSLSMLDDEGTEIQWSLTTPSTSASGTVTYESLSLGTGNDRLVYAQGSVLTDPVDASSSLMNFQPPFDIREERTVLPLFATQHAAGSSQLKNGDASVTQVQTARDVTTLGQNDDTTKVSVELTFATPRYQAWKTYFEDHSHDIAVSVDKSKEEVTVQFDTYEVSVAEIATDLRVERETPR
jgi:hypothetical protein